MERLTERHHKASDGYYMKCSGTCGEGCCDGCPKGDEFVNRLGQIEEILGDTYDLDRLRELVEESKKSRARKCPKCGRMKLYPCIEWKYFYCYSCETTFPAEEIIRPKGTITKGAAK